VVALAPWHVQLWLVDVDCAFYNPAPTTISDEPTSVLVPPNVPEESIATVRHFSPEATARLMDLTEARPLIRIEMTVKTPTGGHLISLLVGIVATLDFVSEDFARRFDLQTSKSQTKTPLRLANGQRVTSSTLCDITFELARHEFQRNVYVLRGLSVADLALGLPWLNDEHASLQFGTTRVFTLMGGTTVEMQIEERRLECIIIFFIKIQKLVRKTVVSNTF
jgi:hypothetical protein